MIFVIARGRGLPEKGRPADDDAGISGVRNRCANGAEARDQARQRNRIGSRKRDYAPQYPAIGKRLVHSETRDAERAIPHAIVAG